MEVFVPGSIMLDASNMGSNKNLGGDEDFNAGVGRGEWGSLWKNGK